MKLTASQRRSLLADHKNSHTFKYMQDKYGVSRTQILDAVSSAGGENRRKRHYEKRGEVSGLAGVAVRLWKQSEKEPSPLKRHKMQRAIIGNFADVEWKKHVTGE